MADGDHIFGEIYLFYQPKIQLNFQEVISANQIESSLGIASSSSLYQGNRGLVNSGRHNVSAVFFRRFFCG
jgi:hypothetical protein